MTSFIVPISFYNFPVKIDASVQFKRTKHDIVLCKKACSMQRKSRYSLGNLRCFFRILDIRISHWCSPTTEGAEFWIICKQLAFLSNFSCLQVTQKKRPWCSAAAYVTARYQLISFSYSRALIRLTTLTDFGCSNIWSTLFLQLYLIFVGS